MTQNNILGLLLFWFSSTAHCQVVQTVRDSLSKQFIPYANIWVENEMIGTTTNVNGEYSFSKIPNGKTIVLSAIGYKTKKMTYDESRKIVLLQPLTTELKELIVRGERKVTQIELGKFKRSKIRHYYGCTGHPYMLGKYFPFHESFAKTPFLDRVLIFTSSDIKDARINVRLYTLNEAGIPEKSLLNENRIVIVKKGNNITKVDFSDKLIEIPQTGMLIAVEFLVVEKNKYKYQYRVENSKAAIEGTSYEPAFGTIPVESAENSWQYNMGQWSRTSRMTHVQLPEYKDKFAEIAVKLVLTN